MKLSQNEENLILKIRGIVKLDNIELQEEDVIEIEKLLNERHIPIAMYEKSDVDNMIDMFGSIQEDVIKDKECERILVKFED